MTTTSSSEDDYTRGAKVLAEYLCSWNARREDLDPVLTTIVENIYGKIWSREGLTLRERSLITLAATIALGRPDEMKSHLRGATHIGIDRDTIQEMVLHLGHYGGFPAALDAWRAAQEFFEQKAGG